MLTFNFIFTHPAQLPRSLKTLGRVKGALGQTTLSPKEKWNLPLVTHSLAKMPKVLNKNKQLNILELVSNKRKKKGESSKSTF